eukprot:g15263.t1
MNHIVMHYPHKEAKKKFYLVTNVVAGTERKQWSAMCWPCCAATSSISVFTVSRNVNNRDAEGIPPLVLRSRKEHLNLFSRYVRNIVKLASVSGRGAFVDDDVGPAVTKSEIRSRILHELGPVGVAVGWEIFQALRLRWRQRQKVEKTECDEITTAKFASAKDLLDDGLSDTEKIKMLHTCPPWKALEKTPTERARASQLERYFAELCERPSVVALRPVQKLFFGVAGGGGQSSGAGGGCAGGRSSDSSPATSSHALPVQVAAVPSPGVVDFQYDPASGYLLVASNVELQPHEVGASRGLVVFFDQRYVVRDGGKGDEADEGHVSSGPPLPAVTALLPQQDTRTGWEALLIGASDGCCVLYNLTSLQRVGFVHVDGEVTAFRSCGTNKVLAAFDCLTPDAGSTALPIVFLLQQNQGRTTAPVEVAVGTLQLPGIRSTELRLHESGRCRVDAGPRGPGNGGKKAVAVAWLSESRVVALDTYGKVTVYEVGATRRSFQQQRQRAVLPGETVAEEDLLRVREVREEGQLDMCELYSFRTRAEEQPESFMSSRSSGTRGHKRLRMYPDDLRMIVADDRGVRFYDFPHEDGHLSVSSFLSVVGNDEAHAQSRQCQGGLNSTLIQEKADLDECVGEGRGDHKCHNDETHRVCAKLVGDKETCKPLAWNKDGRNFWEITGQPTWQKDICKLGTNWCICMWATATLISDVGCDHVTLDCAATDVAHVMKSYEDTGVHGKVDLKPAKECLKQKCSKELGTGAANQQAGPAATRAPVAAGEEAKAAEDLASSSLR